MTQDMSQIWVASLATGVACAALAYLIAAIITAVRLVDPEKGRFEVARREQLRGSNAVYRNFEPLIDELVPGIRRRGARSLESIRQNLIGSDDPAPWEPEEFVAVCKIEAVGAALIGALFGWFMLGSTGIALGGIVSYVVYQKFQLRALSIRARKRRETIKRRLASAIDMMSLMMEVGGSFQDSLLVVAREAKDHPLGQELERIVHDTTSGQTRKTSLQNFANRLADEDAQDLAFSVIKGEELGTPLAAILGTQAVQMRQKRTQWAEKASQEAQVTLVFPAMLIMVACLILVAAPFLLAGLGAYNQ